LKAVPAVLVLEDATSYIGFSLGAIGKTYGEVVFNTGMTGYQEILTDPSYAGQIVTMTYPLIGNYGVNSNDNESAKPFLKGFVVKEAANIYSNWRAEGSLDDFLKQHGVVGIQGIDTRALTRRIRRSGAMKGLISSVKADVKTLIEDVRNTQALLGTDLAAQVTSDNPYLYRNNSNRYNIVALDFGIKENILRLLTEHGFKVQVVPASTKAADILSANPDGVFLSNGPGDPQAVDYAVAEIGKLLGKVPLFGICLGHQLMALAMGAKTYKLKFGHHGSNHPVKNLTSGMVEITAQNHGFAVEPETLPANARLTHMNLNDNTVEGISLPDLSAFSVQYHPEASPGPHDSAYLFNDFIKLIEGFKRRTNV